MGTIFWDASLGEAPLAATGRALRTLLLQQATGALFFRAPRLTDIDVYFQRGRLVACTSISDDWTLARLLLSSNMVSAQVSTRSLDGLHTTTLADALVTEGEITPQALEPVLLDLTRDRFIWACITPWHEIRFEPMESLHPPCECVDLDTAQLLLQANEWYAFTRPFHDLLRRTGEVWIEPLHHESAPTAEQRILLSLVGEGDNYSTLMRLAPLVRFRAMSALVEMVERGTLAAWPIRPALRASGGASGMSGSASGASGASGS